MKILVEIKCPENWKQDYFEVVKAALESVRLIDASIEVLE